MKKALLISLVVLGILTLYLWSTYNSFITKNEDIDNKWAQVETQYQRRYELIPSLVESVKEMMKQEQEVFGALADARTQYAGANTTSEKVAATGQVESALSRLLVIMENYPELKSSESVQTLMAQLEGTENRISVERKRYNDTVTIFNKSVKMVPSSLVAKLFGFEARPYFESTQEAEQAPQVQL